MRLFILFFCFSFSAGASEDRRIITLNPTLTEIIFALGAGNEIVGTVDASDFPEEAKKIKRVGSYGKPNIEKVIELKPDYVLTFKEGYDEVTPQLERAKISLRSFDGRSLKDFEKIVVDLGQILGRNEQAQSLVKNWKAEWSKFPKSKILSPILIQLEQSPLIVADGDSFISEITDRCGFYNVFQDLKSYPAVSQESLHGKKIETVLVLIEKVSEQNRDAIAKRWKAFPQITEKKTVFYDPHELSRLTPRLPAEAMKLCKRLGQ